MKTITKAGMVVACTGLFLGLAVLGLNLKIETKPETINAENEVCQPMIEGSAIVRYNTATHRTHSRLSHINLTNCSNPSVVTQSRADSVKCANTANTAIGTCNNDSETTSTDLHSYAVNVTPSGFDVFLSAESLVWPEGKDFTVDYQVFCGSNNTAVCADQKLITGVSHVTYTNGQAHSSFAEINLPSSCDISSVLAQTYTDGVKCGNGSGSATCLNDPRTTSTDLKAFVNSVNFNSFKTFLSTNDGVWVGSVSPNFSIGWQAMCTNSVGSSGRTAFGGVTTTSYFNGTSNSVPKHITFPVSCPNPSVVTQSYTDSIACGSGSGPGTCGNDPGTNSTDIYSHISNLTPNGVDVFLSSNDAVWVGAASPQFKIAYHVVCNDATPACSQNSDCGTNSFTGSLTCQNNDSYQNYRTHICNNPGTQEARCSQSDELKLKQMCAAAQACDTGGCYPETW